ncbi:PP2C family protein-serine/threonine phosphatase [Streptomyces olivaceoviridis]
MGDVRGKGPAAVGEAALLLSAFRLTAADHPSLPGLATTLDDHVHRYLTDFSATDDETGGHFITALLLDLPADEPLARLTAGTRHPCSCGRAKSPGRSPPTRLRPWASRLISANPHAENTVPFDTGDTLLLYTDGVIDARDTSGAFHPLAERVARWARCPPTALVKHLRRDLLTPRSTSWTSMHWARAAPMGPVPSTPGGREDLAADHFPTEESAGRHALLRRTPRHQQRTIPRRRSASAGTSSAAGRIERSDTAGSGSPCAALRVPSGYESSTPRTESRPTPS